MLQQIPKDLFNFLLVAIFSLIIGLEQRSHHIDKEFESLFGTDRTFTLTGILGFSIFIIISIFLQLLYRYAKIQYYVHTGDSSFTVRQTIPDCAIEQSQLCNLDLFFPFPYRCSLKTKNENCR